MESLATLRSARLAAGLSQRELAQLAATSQSAVSCYERGWVSPSIRTLDRLLEICGDPAARARSYAAEAPARRVLKRFPVTLEDWDCRPYFMWSGDASWRDVVADLRSSDPGVRQPMLAQVLDNAKWQDIWRLVSPAEICSDLPMLQVRRKSTWAFFLERVAIPA